MKPTPNPNDPRAAKPVWRSERGAAMVEFALVLPLLLLLVLAMLDFGRALNYWIDTNHLANATARWAAVDNNPGPGGTLQDSIKQQANTTELRDGGTTSVPTPASVCIDFPDDSANVGDPVQATVSVDYSWMPLIDLATSTLESSATMRLEQEPSEYGAGCS
jgi:Flp pilus assembly protein TadG